MDASGSAARCEDGRMSLADPAALTADVLAAMETAAAAEIMPRWRNLEPGEVRTKDAWWDLVTDGDVRAERMLTESLPRILDLPVVGEEAVAADESIVELVGASEACWIVDPIDGTRNFVDGREDFACMVALVVGGRMAGGWITHPATGGSLWAAAGAGAHLNGERLEPAAHPALSAGPEDPVCGSPCIHRAEDLEVPLAVAADALGQARLLRGCAGWDYYDLVTGATDYVLYRRTKPWDHAPGALIAQEAGMRAARPDGSEYLPGDGGAGLLVAAPTQWQRVADGLGLPGSLADEG